MTTWKVITQTSIYKADQALLDCPVDTIIEESDNVFTIDGDVILINRGQLQSNTDTFEKQPPAFGFDVVTHGGKTIHVKFLVDVPTLSDDDKATLGAIVETWLNNKDG